MASQSTIVINEICISFISWLCDYTKLRLYNLNAKLNRKEIISFGFLDSQFF